jgi:hypothetical protein
MFATLGDCEGDTVAQPLTEDSIVLVCDAHLRRLFALRRDIAETRRLRRYLGIRFGIAA